MMHQGCAQIGHCSCSASSTVKGASINNVLNHPYFIKDRARQAHALRALGGIPESDLAGVGCAVQVEPWMASAAQSQHKLTMFSNAD